MQQRKMKALQWKLCVCFSMLVFVALELAGLLCGYYLLEQQDVDMVQKNLESLGGRISRSMVIQLNTTSFNLREYAAVTRSYGIYRSAQTFADLLQMEYNPQTITVQSYAFVAVILQQQRAMFEQFCTLNIDPNCTIKDISGQNQYRRAAIRTVYYPVMNLHPSPYTPSLIGLDLALPPLNGLLSELQASADVNDTVITQKVELAVTDTQNNYGVVIVHPAFAKDRQRLLGFHAGILRLADIVQQAFTRVNLKRDVAAVAVFDITDQASTMLYRDNIVAFAKVFQAVDVKMYDVHVTLHVNNRQWQVFYLFTDEYKQAQKGTLPVLITAASAGLFVLVDIIVLSLLVLNKYWS
jgi:CHASE domain